MYGEWRRNARLKFFDGRSTEKRAPFHFSYSVLFKQCRSEEVKFYEIRKIVQFKSQLHDSGAIGSFLRIYIWKVRLIKMKSFEKPNFIFVNLLEIFTMTMSVNDENSAGAANNNNCTKAELEHYDGGPGSDLGRSLWHPCPMPPQSGGRGWLSNNSHGGVGGPGSNGPDGPDDPTYTPLVKVKFCFFRFCWRLFSQLEVFRPHQSHHGLIDHMMSLTDDNKSDWPPPGRQHPSLSLIVVWTTNSCFDQNSCWNWWSPSGVIILLFYHGNLNLSSLFKFLQILLKNWEIA